MELQVQLDERVIYDTSFAILLAAHTDVETEEHESSLQSSLQFSFTAPRSIVWQGYKDDEENTASGQEILGDIWQAGAEPECLVLGISFRGLDSIYMNTLHLAYPDDRSESVVTPGLKIVTAPQSRLPTR